MRLRGPFVRRTKFFLSWEFFAVHYHLHLMQRPKATPDQSCTILKTLTPKSPTFLEQRLREEYYM